jgi:hypothetical protein
MRSVILRTFVASVVVAAGAAPVRGQATPMPRPVAPYITSACPFECCTYGAWRFETPVVLRSAPRPDAPQVARLDAGARVRADSGRVQVDTFGIVVAMRGFEDRDGGGRYIAGDTLLVLDYLGEGFFHVWVRGEKRQQSLADVLQSFGPPVGRATLPLREVRPPVSNWWAHVTLPPLVRKDDRAAERRGWVLMAADVNVRGADACGGPG